VNGSLIDLAGLQVGAEDFLAAVLDSVAQPVWVVDPKGVIRFANPAAIAALGYDGADELLGRNSHETIHHSHPDGSHYPAADCPMLLPRTTGETVARDLDWFFRRDGSMFPVSYVSVPLEMADGRGAVVAFTDIEERTRAERELRERDEVLSAQQASLRRLATLVARGAASAEVFAAIAREVSEVIGLPLVALWRFDSDETATVIGAWGERPHPFQAGTRWPLNGPTICARVRASGRPERIDDFAAVPGTIADAAREAGIRGCAGAPIIVDGEIWGAMSADSTDRAPLPDRVETRLAEFTELIATAISNVEARSELAASRARVVAAADEERRRVVRDLHDGAQQRLVHTVVTLQLALQENPESQLLREALTQAQRATEELRELAQGILPGILTQGGLGAALEGLASRTPVPVEVSVAVDRLPAAVEATAYFVVSEALTNVAKHARATGATVLAWIEDGVLSLRVRDDGVGGARRAGSGLVGLADRLAALDGELRVESPPGGGTLVAADIPVRSSDGY
jgi:PAS domain S-box-containing protein